LSITPTNGPEDGHAERLAYLAKLLASSQAIAAETQEFYGLELERLGGDMQAVQASIARTQSDVKSLQARVDGVEAREEVGTSLPTHKALTFAGIEEQPDQGNETGKLLSKICRQMGLRDEFCKKEVKHPGLRKPVGSYTYELWAWFFKEMGLQRPSFMEQVMPAQFTYWPSLKQSIANYKAKYGY